MIGQPVLQITFKYKMLNFKIKSEKAYFLLFRNKFLPNYAFLELKYTKND